MKKVAFLSLTAVLALTVSSQAAGLRGFFCNAGAQCVQHEADCPDCSDPCCTRLHLPTIHGAEHTQCLIEKLCSGDCCERIAAAKKLGSRLHADFCCNPEIVTALVHALQCDTCWEVRREAAWSLAMQGARTRVAVLALYIAGKMDPHYMVRARAAEGLDILILCRAACYKDLFAAGDVLVVRLRGKYQPTKGSCVNLTEACLALCEGAPVPVEVAPVMEKTK